MVIATLLDLLLMPSPSYNNTLSQSTVNTLSSSITDREQERALTKSKLSWLLVVAFPVFPVLYLLNYFGVLSTDGLLVGYMVGGFLAKFAYVSTLSMESNMLQVAAERRLTESRRQFLRYIFHEVRVPLNTLTMGISVLKRWTYEPYLLLINC